MPVLLTVVIPAFNEASRIPQSLQASEEYCLSLGIAYEILVVDDGSTDDTAIVVRQFQTKNPCVRLVSYSPNRGKGYAVRQGILQAKGEFVLYMDADLSTPMDEFSQFLPHLENGVPVVIGTRKHPEAEILKHQPLWRESMGKAFTRLSNLILGLRVSDFTCGFKVFHHDAALRIFKSVTLPGWAFDSEMLFLAHRFGFSIAEVPVRWANSPESKVRIVRATANAFIDLFRIRLNHLLGRYDLSKRALETLQAVEGEGERNHVK